MPRKTSGTLTEAELRLMNVLWSRGESTVAEVAQALADPPLAYTSVLTTMRILERKGYVRHRAEGRAFAYSARVARGEARTHAVDQLVHKFFDGSATDLVLQLMDRKALGAEDRDRIRELLDLPSERTEPEGRA